jgi:hypothetical protein
MVHWLPTTNPNDIPVNTEIIIWHDGHIVPVVKIEDGNYLTMGKEARTIKADEVKYWSGANKP